MKNKIVYDGRVFQDPDIASGEVHLAMSLPHQRLEANTFSAVVKCSDPTLTNFKRNEPLHYYHRDRLVMIAYVQTVDRIGPDRYEIRGTSAIGRLLELPHAGGIYTGQTAAEVIADICGPVPHLVKTSLEGIKLYGWLPYANPPRSSARDNLVQVLFAIGGVVKTDLDGVLRIEKLWDGISGNIGRKKMYAGARSDYGSRVTQVVVTEHQYVPWTESVQLFEGTAQAGDIIVFDDPMHSLSATGFTILASGANWARVSAGSGTLAGKTYLHNTRQVTKDVQEAATPNVQTVADATLVSLANSSAVAQRLADYYRWRETVEADVLYRGEVPGDRLGVYHPFDKADTSGCLESADISISNTLKAREKLLAGYTPPSPGDMDYIDTTMEITSSGVIQIPEGVTEVTAVLIGGGDGGQRGGNGSAGSAGTQAHTSGNLSKPSGLTQGKPGKGGAGGTVGNGGSGGKVLVVNIDMAGISALTVNVGAPGAANGGLGGASTVSAGGTTYSSAAGGSAESGYTDIISGKTYAMPGLPGEYPGGKGGDGVSGTSGSGEDGGSVAGYPGGKGNTYSVQVGSIQHVLPAGGGAAAYGNAGGNAPSNNHGGVGANAVQRKAAPTTPGSGGHGGNGGGGGGGGGAGYIDGGLPSYQTSVNGRAGGPGGSGSNGTAGAPGIVLLFYREAQKISAGWLIDKNGKRFLDNLVRRFVT